MSDRLTLTPRAINLVKMFDRLNTNTKEKFSIDKFPVDEKMIPPNFQLVLKDPEYKILATEIDDLAKDFDKSPNNLLPEQIKLREKYLDILLKIMEKGPDFAKKVLSVPPEDTFQSWQGFNGVTQNLGQITNSLPSDKVKIKSEFETLSQILKTQETKKLSEIDIKKIQDQINTIKSSGGAEAAEILNNFEQQIVRLQMEKERNLRNLENFDGGFNTVKRIVKLFKDELKPPPPPPPCVIPPCNEKKYMISTAILSIVLGIAIISFIIFMMFFRNKR